MLDTFDPTNEMLLASIQELTTELAMVKNEVKKMEEAING